MPIPAADIVGIGAVTGYGWGMPVLWSGLLSGHSAARPHTGLGGRFPDPCWMVRIPDGGDPEHGSTRYARAVAAAADEAIADARARGWRPGERVALLHCTTGADRELWRERYLDPDVHNPRRRFVQQVWTTPGALVMRRHGFHGPYLVLSAACSSALHAIAMGQRLIATGDATDVVVTSGDVGYDGEEIGLFARLNALVHDSPPEQVCRPLQAGTRGFVIGEATGALVLSSSDRTARPYLRLRGSALSNDAYHPIAIEPSFKHVIATVDTALGHAGLAAQDADFYAAHGTGTEQCNDADEFVVEYLGKQAVCYGFKSMLGHAMGTAPLLETLITARSYVEGMLPATMPVAEAHPQLARGHLAHPGGVTLQLGLGFGGNIAVAVFDSATEEPSWTH
jgi:3-oxoacyl-[acyl-carrier-protein] synthase II